MSHFTVYLRRLLHDTPNFAARLVRTLQKNSRNHVGDIWTGNNSAAASSSSAFYRRAHSALLHYCPLQARLFSSVNTHLLLCCCLSLLSLLSLAFSHRAASIWCSLICFPLFVFIFLIYFRCSCLKLKFKKDAKAGAIVIPTTRWRQRASLWLRIRHNPATAHTGGGKRGKNLPVIGVEMTEWCWNV